VTINCHYKEIKYCDSLKGSAGQKVKRYIFEWLKQYSIVRYGTELFEIARIEQSTTNKLS